MDGTWVLLGVISHPIYNQRLFLVPLIGGIGDIYKHTVGRKNATDNIPLIVLANWVMTVGEPAVNVFSTYNTVDGQNPKQPPGMVKTL